MFSRPKILFLVSLLFVALLNPKFNPYLLFKFLIFYHSSDISLHGIYLITWDIYSASGALIPLQQKSWRDSCDWCELEAYKRLLPLEDEQRNK